ncbi:MFS transporter [Burkholderia sp. 3C]
MMRRVHGMLAMVLPATRNGRIIAAGATVDSIGSGMFMAAATLFFVTNVGIPALFIGTTLAAANVCGLLSPVPIGKLADRFGAAPVMIVLLVIRAAGYAGYAFVASPVPYLLLTCLLTACDRAAPPLMQVVVGQVEGQHDYTRTMASIRAIRNVGVTAGFLLASVVQAMHSHAAFTALFLVNSLSFLIFARCIAGVARTAGLAAPAQRQETPEPVTPQAAAPAPAAAESPFRNLRFMLVTLSESLMALHDSILLVLIPLWIVQKAHAPASVSSLVLAVNTVLTVLMQVHLSSYAKGVRASLRLWIIASGLLVSACLIFAFAEGHALPVVIVGVTIALLLLTVGENLHSVAGWQLSYEMAPERSRGRYLAMFSLGDTIQRIVGPILMTGVVLTAGTWGWALLIGLFLLAGLITRLAVPVDRLDPRPSPAASAGTVNLEKSTS